ncbi:hypothetical protein B0H13DRAFT_1857368 [Mycena leptocephala]|nr:hypothetical protein B0H13DRAFT_1857368 [Mycena leptocephala]
MLPQPLSGRLLVACAGCIFPPACICAVQAVTAFLSAFLPPEARLLSNQGIADTVESHITAPPPNYGELQSPRHNDEGTNRKSEATVLLRIALATASQSGAQK